MYQYTVGSKLQTFKYTLKSRNLTPSGIETGIIRSTVRMRSKMWAVLLWPMRLGHICECPGNNTIKHAANAPKSAWQLYTVAIQCFRLNLHAGNLLSKPISFFTAKTHNILQCIPMQLSQAQSCFLLSHEHVAQWPAGKWRISSQHLIEQNTKCLKKCGATNLQGICSSAPIWCRMTWLTWPEGICKL